MLSYPAIITLLFITMILWLQKNEKVIDKRSYTWLKYAIRIENYSHLITSFSFRDISMFLGLNVWILLLFSCFYCVDLVDVATAVAVAVAICCSRCSCLLQLLKLFVAVIVAVCCNRCSCLLQLLKQFVAVIVTVCCNRCSCLLQLLKQFVAVIVAVCCSHCSCLLQSL